MDVTAFAHLDRWERYYLVHSVGRDYVSVPKHSKVTDRLMDHGMIHTLGFVIGRYVDFQKTALGHRVVESLSELATASAGAAEGAE